MEKAQNPQNANPCESLDAMLDVLKVNKKVSELEAALGEVENQMGATKGPEGGDFEAQSQKLKELISKAHQKVADFIKEKSGVISSITKLEGSLAGTEANNILAAFQGLKKDLSGLQNLPSPNLQDFVQSLQDIKESLLKLASGANPQAIADIGADIKNLRTQFIQDQKDFWAQHEAALGDIKKVIEMEEKAKDGIQLSEVKQTTDSDWLHEESGQLEALAGKHMLYMRRILDPHLHTKSIDFILAEAPEAKTKLASEVDRHAQRKKDIQALINKELTEAAQDLQKLMKEIVGKTTLSSEAALRRKIYATTYLIQRLHIKRNLLLKAEEERHAKAHASYQAQSHALDEIAAFIPTANTEGTQPEVSKRRQEFIERTSKEKVAIVEELKSRVSSTEEDMNSQVNKLLEHKNTLKPKDDKVTADLNAYVEKSEALSQSIKEKFEQSLKLLQDAELGEHAGNTAKVMHKLADVLVIAQQLPSPAEYASNLEKVINGTGFYIQAFLQNPGSSKEEKNGQVKKSLQFVRFALGDNSE